MNLRQHPILHECAKLLRRETAARKCGRSDDHGDGCFDFLAGRNILDHDNLGRPFDRVERGEQRIILDCSLRGCALEVERIHHVLDGNVLLDLCAQDE